jgi:6-phosphogluconolactonase
MAEDAPSKKATPPVLYGFESTDSLSEGLASFVLAAQDEALKKQGSFKLAISGGSLPKVLGKNLIERKDVSWDKWLVPPLLSLSRVGVFWFGMTKPTHSHA